ncbi:MAG: PAS domain S-box protein [Acidobacteriota bacterium]
MAKRKIQIVDDEMDVARDLEQLLTGLGYEVTGIASSGSEAAALAARVPPDLILIAAALRGDFDKMASADGMRGRPKIPSVFMITDTDEESLDGTDSPHSYGYVVRPFTERELRAGIDLALCKHDAAAAVHQLEDRFFTDSIDLLCFLDFNGHFKRLNPAWERTLGFTRQELMSKPFIEFVHPDDRERTLDQNRRVRGGGQALAFENRYLCKDGSYRWFRWNASPDSAEKVIYSVARDVTESKQAEEERERLVSELRAALAEVKTLREILPICSYCKKIRDDNNYWHTVETYLSKHSLAKFSHGICPSCMATQVPPQFRE